MVGQPSRIASREPCRSRCPNCGASGPLGQDWKISPRPGRNAAGPFQASQSRSYMSAHWTIAGISWLYVRGSKVRIAWAVRLLLSSSVTASNVRNLKALLSALLGGSACYRQFRMREFHISWPVLTWAHYLSRMKFDFGVSSPIKLFEYLAAGLPILATRIDCHTNVVGNADCAVWLDEPNRRWVRDDPDAIVDGERTFHGWALRRP